MKPDTEIVVWIILFFSGMFLGIVSEQNEIVMWPLPEWFYISITTLVAAFSGAWFAYRLETKRTLEREAADKLLGVNRILFSLTKEINSVLNIQKQLVDPVFSSPLRYLEMPPTLAIDPQKFKFDVAQIDFLLITKHSPILMDLIVVQER